jgi:type IV secretory pathway TraG/TraD family ATPase VirD4
MTNVTTPIITPPHAPQRSYAHVVRQIERHRGPVIVTSFGAQLYNRTRTERAKRGDVQLFDPFGVTGEASNTWSPLTHAVTWDGALDVAWWFASAGERDQRGVESADFWAVLAEQRLAPLLYAAANAEAPIEQLIAWAYGQGTTKFHYALDIRLAVADTDQRKADARAAYGATQSFAEHADRTRTAVAASICSLLRAYRYTRVATSAHGSQISASSLLAASNTLYLIGDTKAAKLLRPIMTALITSLIDGVNACPAARGPVLLVEADPSLFGTMIDEHAGQRLVDAGRLGRLALPASAATQVSPETPRRRLRFHSPINFG